MCRFCIEKIFTQDRKNVTNESQKNMSDEKKTIHKQKQAKRKAIQPLHAAQGKQNIFHKFLSMHCVNAISIRTPSPMVY